MKKLKYILVGVLIFTGVAQAQQLPQYSQYMLNDYVVNPAAANQYDYFQAKSNNRYQWSGFADAPRTYVLSLFGPDKAKPMGYGGYVYNDVTGPTSRIGAYGSYSYQLTVKEGMNLSMGLSLGVTQFSLDGTRIQLGNDNDPALNKVVNSNLVPDATLGLFFYTDDYYVGFSAAQLMGFNVKFDDVETTGVNKLKNHYFLAGGYKYKLNEDVIIEPSLMIQSMMPAPIQMDLAARVKYKNMFWAGLSYRTKDAATVLLGYNYKDQLTFGYSYDITTSKLSKYSNGTHEIMIGVRFKSIKSEIVPEVDYSDYY